MSDKNYQLDLLNAMNQKLLDNDRMFRMICGTSSNTFMYYDFAEDHLEILGNSNQFFDFPIENKKDLERIPEHFLPEYRDELSQALFIDREGKTSANCEARTDNGKWLGFEVTVSYDDAGSPSEKIIRLHDSTREKQQTESLKYMAYYDPLTGLYNRNYFVRLLSDWVRRAEETTAGIELLCIKVDEFKEMNDAMGMIAGDEIIQNLGLYIRDFQSEYCLISHFHSNVFFIAFFEPERGAAKKFFKRINNHLKDPMPITGKDSINISVSGGISVYPSSAKNSIELINCAEIALEQQKKDDMGQLYEFETPVLDDFLNMIAMENDLKSALDERAFELYYQPQYDSLTKKLRGVEALIRWKNAEGFYISPSRFIPLAERAGLIDHIGKWVLEEALSAYSHWMKNFSYPIVMSVNISAIQFKKTDFIPHLFSLIDKYEVNPSFLELEITESVLIDDPDGVLSSMSRIREKGIKISLDDFGTGYSSLSYLKSLPIDTLKIDKSFIDTVISDNSTRIITESIIAMVKKLGYETVAEGVENDQQFEYLKSIECDNIQGFLLGKPMPGKSIEELLEKLA
ncbi:MAG: GGDEF domain-containing protein [Lachnospiraceae bacterium]|nr:GGDEF domain-containing protein [Lachnospiraceae bacterium]